MLTNRKNGVEQRLNGVTNSITMALYKCSKARTCNYC